MTGVRLGGVGLGIAAGAAIWAAVSTAASADVYSWTDDRGVLNFGNVDPPAGASTSLVVREAPMRPAAAGDTARQAELRALSARVRQLEAEVAQDNAPPAYPPPPGAYPPAGYPTGGAYPAYPPSYQEPAVAAYPPPPPAWSAAECDPVFSDCFGGIYSSYLPPVYTVFAPVPFRHHAGYRPYAAGRGFGPRSGSFSGPVRFGGGVHSVGHASRH